MDRALSLFRLDKLSWVDAVDIALVAILLYFALDAVRGTRAAQMLLGIGLLFAFFELTAVLQLRAFHKVMEYAFRYIPFVIVVVFQAEIRRALAALGRNTMLRSFWPVRNPGDVLGEIVFAVTTLSSQRIGALIVLERSHRLKNFIEAGIQLDAVVSYDLLVNIFHPDTPLHDGAVIISGGRAAAASCFLPLTLQASLSKQYGTRHRAAIGICEETDAVAVVVSEETGEVSVAVEGKIRGGLWAQALQQHLQALFHAPPDKPKAAHATRT